MCLCLLSFYSPYDNILKHVSYYFDKEDSFKYNFKHFSISVNVFNTLILCNMHYFDEPIHIYYYLYISIINCFI